MNRIRRIEYSWNLDGPLAYKSPEEIVRWVRESGFTESISGIVKDVNECLDVMYKYGAVFDKFRYVEYSRDGINIKLNCGQERNDHDYYMEIWHDDTLVMWLRLGNREFTIQNNTVFSMNPNILSNNANRILRFMACCMIYTSMMLVDSVLWNDSTDSINTMVIEEDLSMKTKAFVGEFKGHKTFGVWEVNNEGQKTGKYPLVSVGLKKAEALVSHYEELAKFIEDNKGKNNKFNTSKLSEDERSRLTALLNKMS